MTWHNKVVIYLTIDVINSKIMISQNLSDRHIKKQAKYRNKAIKSKGQV